MKKNYYQDHARIAEGNYVHINYLNNSIILLDEVTHDAYENIDDVSSLESSFPQLYKLLFDNGFIVSDIFDELSFADMSRHFEQYDRTLYHVIVNPTLDCNLSCWYCYENRKMGSKMGNSVVEGIKKMIHNHYDFMPFKSLKLSFFGGEPFVQYGVINELVDYSKKFCDKNGIALMLDFTTNGTLITKSEIVKLSRFACQFQITLDGCREQHNKVKFSTNKSFDSYKRTIENVKLIQREIPGAYIFLRINFDSVTLTNFDDILSDIDDLDRRKTTVILKRIWQVKQGVVAKNDILSAINKLFAKGFIVDYYSQGKLCFGERVNEVVVNYDGNVFKCTTIDDFNETNSFGKLDCDSGKVFWNQMKLAESVAELRLSKCKKCKQYPSCYGPCNNHILAGKDNCYMDGLDLSKEEYFTYLLLAEYQKTIVLC